MIKVNITPARETPPSTKTAANSLVQGTFIAFPKEVPMARIFFSLLVLSLASGLMGCYHVHGVCDCDHDEAPCTHRAPWANASGVPISEATIMSPAPVLSPPQVLPPAPPLPK
jgi:hypothetical protein